MLPHALAFVFFVSSSYSLTIFLSYIERFTMLLLQHFIGLKLLERNADRYSVKWVVCLLVFHSLGLNFFRVCIVIVFASSNVLLYNFLTNYNLYAEE